MKPYYDPRSVLAHGEPSAVVLLMNEAPGPREAEAGIPSFGQQGANIYHALRRAGVGWATSAPCFSWPQKPSHKQSELNRQRLKEEFLLERARYMTCTNSYSYWPKSGPGATDFQDPAEADVLSVENTRRIAREVIPSHKILLVCGEFAYLACFGATLSNPSSRELTSLSDSELASLNGRLDSTFTDGWYMGHTRRWSLHSRLTTRVLRSVAVKAGWVLERLDQPLDSD